VKPRGLRSVPKKRQYVEHFAFSIILTLLFASSLNAQMKSWTDEKGITHLEGQALPPETRQLPEPPGGASVTAPAPTPLPTKAPMQLSSLNVQVSETNSVWWKYSWKITVYNPRDEATMLLMIIKFYDKAGYLIDEKSSSRVVLTPFETKLVAGYSLVNVPIAARVATISAEPIVVRPVQ